MSNSDMQYQSTQQLIQEDQYHFPYHFIPYNVDEVWRISRFLWWGYEYIAVLDTIVNLIISYHPKKVLDFGCGDGRLIHELCREKLAEIVGIDISERARSFSQAISRHDSRVRIYETFRDILEERFDAVIAMEVLEHIHPHELKSILTEIHTALDEVGLFVISVPTCNIPLNRKHYRHFTIFEVEQEIDGLFVIDQTYFIHKIGTLANLLRRMVVNKFVIMNWNPWLKLTTFLYKMYVMNADEVNGAHLIAVLRKI